MSAMFSKTSAGLHAFPAMHHASLGNLGSLWDRRAWSAQGGEAPPGIDEFGEDVWRGTRVAEEQDSVILGAPVGSPEFVADFVRKHVR